MMKWLLLLAGSLLLVQACTSEKKPSESHESQNNEASPSLNEKLLQAAEEGKTEKVRELLADGAEINTRDADGRTPLMRATYQNDVETASLLIDKGADVNAMDNMQNNPFLYAGAEGYIEILKMTIKAGADPTLTNRYDGTALIPAAEHGYVEVVELLLNQTKVDVNHVNNLGWTALLEAIILNDGDAKQQKTIQLLIKHGADVTIADSNGVTPLEHAEEKGFEEIANILRKAGADE